MDLLDRPQHLYRTSTAPATSTTTTSTTTTSELFICFTSRLSSSSMKLSKSILSPARGRDAPLSLPTSLSRRLRTNGSLKGGQASPMFPNGAKKRGPGFENPEPSSPKVTCIGQVRVKTKKKKMKQARSLSKRRSGSGDVSFRSSEAFHQTDDRHSVQPQRLSSNLQQECGSHRNQKWVHLPLTICEALRAFGAEFSCLFPCHRSSCFRGDKNDNNKNNSENSDDSSCGAVFVRWLVALQEGEGGKRRDIELVVEDERIESRVSTTRSSRRHVFDDIEFKDEIVEVESEEKGRVSVCVPPKNALLLMRCRSDPMKMAALTNRFRETPFEKEQEQEEEVDFQECETSNVVEHRVSLDLDEFKENPEEKTCELVLEETKTESFVESHEDNQMTYVESHEDNLKSFVESHEDNQEFEDENEEYCHDSSKTEAAASEDEEELREEEERFKADIFNQIHETVLTEAKNPKTRQKDKSEEEENQAEAKQPALPECLLLMMCEPKLSMEVSKETWVCRRDFLRFLPERKQLLTKPPKKEVCSVVTTEEQQKRRRSTDSKPSTKHQLLQPPRSSCSFPTMAAAIEQKLVNAVAYEPFVLTRCKSEPMRTASAKLVPAPESACCWKNNRKIEPHQPGLGAA